MPNVWLQRRRLREAALVLLVMQRARAAVLAGVRQIVDSVGTIGR